MLDFNFASVSLMSGGGAMRYGIDVSEYTGVKYEVSCGPAGCAGSGNLAFYANMY
jgi:hypothetical protein